MRQRAARREFVVRRQGDGFHAALVPFLFCASGCIAEEPAPSAPDASCSERILKPNQGQGPSIGDGGTEGHKRDRDEHDASGCSWGIGFGAREMEQDVTVVEESSGVDTFDVVTSGYEPPGTSAKEPCGFLLDGSAVENNGRHQLHPQVIPVEQVSDVFFQRGRSSGVFSVRVKQAALRDRLSKKRGALLALRWRGSRTYFVRLYFTDRREPPPPDCGATRVESPEFGNGKQLRVEDSQPLSSLVRKALSGFNMSRTCYRVRGSDGLDQTVSGSELDLVDATHQARLQITAANGATTRTIEIAQGVCAAPQCQRGDEREPGYWVEWDGRTPIGVLLDHDAMTGWQLCGTLSSDRMPPRVWRATVTATCTWSRSVLFHPQIEGSGAGAGLEDTAWLPSGMAALPGGLEPAKYRATLNLPDGWSEVFWLVVPPNRYVLVLALFVGFILAGLVAFSGEFVEFLEIKQEADEIGETLKACGDDSDIGARLYSRLDFVRKAPLVVLGRPGPVLVGAALGAIAGFLIAFSCSGERQLALLALAVVGGLVVGGADVALDGTRRLLADIRKEWARLGPQCRDMEREILQRGQDLVPPLGGTTAGPPDDIEREASSGDVVVLTSLTDVASGERGIYRLSLNSKRSTKWRVRQMRPPWRVPFYSRGRGIAQVDGVHAYLIGGPYLTKAIVAGSGGEHRDFEVAAQLERPIGSPRLPGIVMSGWYRRAAVVFSMMCSTMVVVALLVREPRGLESYLVAFILPFAASSGSIFAAEDIEGLVRRFKGLR